jgi:hypothetical protein
MFDGATMYKLIVAAFALGVTCAPALAQKPSVDAGSVTKATPGKGTTTNVVRISASVEAIDPATRTVTLKGPRGNIVDVTAGPEVRNFDQIKVGDLLVVRYMEALTLELKKGGAGIRERSDKQDAARAPQGGQPAVAGARQVTVMADVIAVDPKKMIVTLRGPKRTVELKLRDRE